MHRTIQCRESQSGAVAIVVGVSLAVLIGFAGLALDLGRLYINKTELQNAVDACALAAAVELNCDSKVKGSCTAAKISKAENAGLFASSRNFSDFQKTSVTAENNSLEVTFSTEFASGYASSGDADLESKYAKCTAKSRGLIPWFMGVLGINKENVVGASAVATLGPGQSFCAMVPMGVCAKAGSSKPNFGYEPGNWIMSDFTQAPGKDDFSLDGEMRWVDFSPSAGGVPEISEQLAGDKPVCDMRINDDVREDGTKRGTKEAYNTRFGLYPNQNNNPKYKPSTSPPDMSGYAYPNMAPGAPVINAPGVGKPVAYPDYLSRQKNDSLFIEDEYDACFGAEKEKGACPVKVDPKYQSNANGTSRRVVSVPIVDCDAGKPVPIKGMACVLMLNPMSNGANGKVYFEYLGSAGSQPECASSGLPGGGGPMVPVLVQ